MNQRFTVKAFLCVDIGESGYAYEAHSAKN